MAATFGASTRATFTAIVFLFELTRDYQVILPLMLAAVVADLVAGALMRETLMTEKLTRRGLRVQTEYEVDVLRTTLVARRHDPPGRDPPDGRHGRRRPAPARAGPPRRLPAGRRSGALRRHRRPRRPAAAARRDDAEPVTAVASRDVVSVTPDDTVFRALQPHARGGGRAPAGDRRDGRLVGICTRTDVLRARRRQLDNERREPGWRFLATKAASEK